MEKIIILLNLYKYGFIFKSKLYIINFQNKMYMISDGT